jgi:hypothetical protein
MAALFTNNAASLVAGGGITSGATSLTVTTGQGSLFPNPSSPDFFWLTLDDGVNIEVVKCTARSTDVLTIVRAQDGTSANAFAAGAFARLRIPRAALQEFHQRDQPNNEWSGIATGSEPAAASTQGDAHPYIKYQAGRGLMKLMPADGWPILLQPAIFDSSILWIYPNTGTTIGVLGGSVTSVGTVSTPAVDTVIGYAVNQVTGAVSGNTAGTGGALAPYFRGNSATTPGGWFFKARVYFVDASYGTSSTGFRGFVGLTNGTMAASVGADDPGGHCAGFTFSTNAGDTNWSFSLRDGSTRNKIGTGIAFTATHIYDFWTYCANNTSTVYWRIDDLTAATTAEGSSSTNAPGATTQMRAGLQIATLTTTGRNVRYKLIYCESHI